MFGASSFFQTLERQKQILIDDNCKENFSQNFMMCSKLEEFSNLSSRYQKGNVPIWMGKIQIGSKSNNFTF